MMIRKNDVYDGSFVAEALEFDLVHRGDSEYDDMKCVSEEHNERAIVLFSFKSIDNVKLSIKLFDPNEKVVKQFEDVSEGDYASPLEVGGITRRAFLRRKYRRKIARSTE